MRTSARMTFAAWVGATSTLALAGACGAFGDGTPAGQISPEAAAGDAPPGDSPAAAPPDAPSSPDASDASDPRRCFSFAKGVPPPFKAGPAALTQTNQGVAIDVSNSDELVEATFDAQFTRSTVDVTLSVMQTGSFSDSKDYERLFLTQPAGSLSQAVSGYSQGGLRAQFNLNPTSVPQYTALFAKPVPSGSFQATLLTDWTTGASTFGWAGETQTTPGVETNGPHVNQLLVRVGGSSVAVGTIPTTTVTLVQVCVTLF